MHVTDKKTSDLQKCSDYVAYALTDGVVVVSGETDGWVACPNRIRVLLI